MTVLVVNPIIQKNHSIIFKTKTIAVCESAEQSIYCHDELLVICGDEEYTVPKNVSQINCSGITMKVPSITGFAVFNKYWKDPRSD